MISVIVPCFNSENTIERCLESIINQTYSNIEILVIDDGSSDDTGEIVKKYASRDKRIKYFYKINEGVSEARNLGLRESKGEYISFVDSDDCLKPDMYQKLVVILKNGFDIAISNVAPIKNEDSSDHSNVLDSSKLLVELVKDKGINGYLWNKLFKSEIIKKNQLFLNKEIHFTEDLLFCVEYVLKVTGKSLKINERLYEYNQSNFSITNEKYNEKRVSAINSLECILKHLRNNKERINDYETVYREYYNYYAQILISTVVNGQKSGLITTDIKDSILEKINEIDQKKIESNKIKFSLKLIKLNYSSFYLIWNLIKGTE